MTAWIRATADSEADPAPHGGIEVTETLPGGQVGRQVKIAAANPH